MSCRYLAGSGSAAHYLREKVDGSEGSGVYERVGVRRAFDVSETKRFSGCGGKEIVLVDLTAAPNLLARTKTNLRVAPLTARCLSISLSKSFNPHARSSTHYSSSLCPRL